MKRIIMVLLAVLLLASSAQAAQWSEGRSPAHPYVGSPEADLEHTMGYIMLYPRTKVPAQHFCDTLYMYLPREDVKAGAGKLRLYTAEGDLADEISFADGDAVVRRAMSEEELDGLMWGGGVCFEARLTESLVLNQNYYVDMDEGCIVTEAGGVASPPVHAKDAWTPLVTGDYGISRLSYAAGQPAEEEEEDEEEEAAEPEAEEAAGETEEAEAKPETPALEPGTPKRTPAAGDTFSFELTLGGEAAMAVIYSANDSVDNAELEYSASGTVTGTVLSDEPSWGVIFLNADGEEIEMIELSR